MVEIGSQPQVICREVGTHSDNLNFHLKKSFRSAGRVSGPFTAFERTLGKNFRGCLAQKYPEDLVSD